MEQHTIEKKFTSNFKKLLTVFWHYTFPGHETVAKTPGISQKKKKRPRANCFSYSVLFVKDASSDRPPPPPPTYHCSESSHVVTFICKGGRVFIYMAIYEGEMAIRQTTISLLNNPKHVFEHQVCMHFPIHVLQGRHCEHSPCIDEEIEV